MRILLLMLGILLTGVVSSARADLNPLLENANKFQSVNVTGLVSVDTLVVDENVRVSLIGIAGPPRPRARDVQRDQHGMIVPDADGDPTTPFEVEAMRYVRGLVQGKSIRLEFDLERRDEDGALEAYVFLPDGTLLNEDILRQGYARLKLRMPNMKYADRFRKAYREARKEMRGMQGNW